MTPRDPTLAPLSPQVSRWVDARNLNRVDQIRALQQQQAAAQASPSASGSSADPSQAAAASPAAAGAGGGFHFICECFFLTARAMHLGVIKCLHEVKDISEEAHRHQQTADALEEQRPRWAGTPQAQQMEQGLAEAQAAVQQLQHARLLFAVALEEPRLIADAIGFYRVMAAWLTRLACAGGAPAYPLPTPCPMEFKVIPEHFVDDLADFLLFVSRLAPHRLEGERLDEFMDFLVLFTGSPLYVKNPYLRSKFVDVLRHWMPNTDPAGRDTQVQAYTRGLFEAHAVSQNHLTHALLSLYVDVEFTGAHTQFYDKMNIRFSLGQLLQYLWTVPAHRRTWCALAGRDDQFYLRFTNMIMNDAIYQLDEALKKIPGALCCVVLRYVALRLVLRAGAVEMDDVAPPHDAASTLFYPLSPLPCCPASLRNAGSRSTRDENTKPSNGG